MPGAQRFRSTLTISSVCDPDGGLWRELQRKAPDCVMPGGDEGTFFSVLAPGGAHHHQASSSSASRAISCSAVSWVSFQVSHASSTGI